MVTGKRPPSGSQRRRRPPTVLDLEATEVDSGPAAATPPADPPADPPAANPPSDPASAATPEPAATSPPAAAPVQEPPAQAASGGPPPPPEPPRREPPPRGFAWLPEELSWSHAIAGIAGAAGGVVVVLLLWLLGTFSAGRDVAAELAPRLASAEKALHELAARQPPPSVDPKAVDDLGARLTRLESAQSAPRAPVTDPGVLGRINAVERALKSLSDNVAALARRSDETDAALRNLQSRLDTLAAGLNDLRTNARAAAAGSDRAARLATAAAVLRAAVERGDRFAAELAVVKPLGPDADLIVSLEPFAATGVPSNAALARELGALIKPMLQAAGAPRRDGSFLERLQASAENLVRVRPVGETSGDDRAAILSRIEQRATHANIPGAIAEIAKLPPDARAPLQAWVAKAEARQRAVEASRKLAADAVAALRTTP